MLKSIAWVTLSFAGLSAASGCSQTASSDGAGFESLTPSPATRTFIVANDVPFARQLVGHNATCAKMPACRK